MPVNLLLCEGGPKSPDIRVLSAVLNGVAGEVRPSGGKQGLRELVKSLRVHNRSCVALADGDFPRIPESWAASDEARRWDDGIEFLGWLWRRKEVENYLLDPEVLKRTFGWTTTKVLDYQAQLAEAAKIISVPTAARMSLVVHAPKKTRLETNVTLTLPDSELRTQLSRRARNYNSGATIKAKALLETYHRLKPECSPSGRLHPSALVVFAGKDLMQALGHMKGVRAIQPELADGTALTESVLETLEKSPAPYTWLPEWSSLRAAVEAWTP